MSIVYDEPKARFSETCPTCKGKGGTFKQTKADAFPVAMKCGTCSGRGKLTTGQAARASGKSRGRRWRGAHKR